ncbi:hypothetical protein [Klebsiella pneumoniae]|uniref:hypothetical protein n=1 Tax=Klebsiella pneumoniae TaxID=573 RepID=UPI00201093EA|nr:hypothetical protein [Klebsiella pneumoniae]MCL0587560.1 hypothetical protein [Klebsiella pneumoniae]
MEFLVALIIFGLSVAVYKDALAKNIARPARWGIGVAFIFIIFLPLYLFKRKKIAGSALEITDAPGIHGGKNLNPLAAYILMFVLSFIGPFLGFVKGDLPGCNSPEVASVITKLLSGQQFSDAAQVSYDKVDEIRHCNLTTSEQVFSYTVKWYSEDKDQFVVKFDN